MQTSQNSQGAAQPLAAQPQSQPILQNQQVLQPAALPQVGTMTNNFAALPQQQTLAQHQAVPQQQLNAQQVTFPTQGLNGGWQSDKDYQERRKMIGKIVLLLQQRKPNAPPEWLKKLPQMAKRLEESLYRSAKSFAEYNDVSTLKQRLQQLALSIGMKTKKMQQAQIQQHQQQLQQQVQQQQQQKAAASQQQQQTAVPQFSIPQAAVQQHAQQVIQPQAAVAPIPVPTAPAQTAPAPRIVNMADINPMIAAPSPPPAAPAPPVQQVQYNPHPQAVATTAPAPAALVPSVDAGRQVSDRQQVLRHQQQRLLLLRHAAKCQHDDNRCPVTPHCAGMKRLWKHIAECKNQKCPVPHCVSSRYVLSHYHRCKDVRCPVCGPVREAIHRSHEKQKHMQALKQRHQQAVEQQSGTAPLAEPPNKRRKSSVGAAPLVGQPRPLAQPSIGAVPSTVVVPSGQPGVRVASTGGIAVGRVKPNVASVPGLAFSNGQVIMPKTSGPKPQEDHTLINTFSVAEIEAHIASLSNGLILPPQRLKEKAMSVLKLLQAHQHAWVFNTPVDPVELGLPDYFQVIKHPMDLGSVRKKLDNGLYHRLEEFEAHVNLTFDNAMLYNPEGSVVYNMAKDMKTKFQSDFSKMMAQLNAEEDVKRRNGEACLLCGCEKLLFEPPVFYCNGMNCPSKRIRRNSYYYVAGNNQYHWCHQCYGEIRDNTTLDLGEISMKKEALVKKKNDEVHEESWVQCDRCERWVHQICALFNTRQNKDQRSEYACPKCTLEQRKKEGKLEATSTSPDAEDLTRTNLSEFLENQVREKVNEFRERMIRTEAETEGIDIEEARKKTDVGGRVTIRQVTSMDRKLEVRDRMKKRYAFKNYPEEFNFRCKCICVFQNIDGVDVMLFGLYVYEHDENNPAPNTRTVYISYLDSVHYMRPREMRTFIYHEILISYLDYVRRRGFATAHIWACPPLKGDDYILYAKPEDQKVPKDDRLRQWYVDMLVECQRRGIVGKLTNMYDLYFSDPKNDASVVPYMDGDYFPAEVENIIKEIEDKKSGKKNSAKAKQKDKKAKQKKKSGRFGTRSVGLDEEAYRASGLLPPGTDSKSLEEGARDYVMVKLGEIIQPMKESFIVAYLAWNGAREEDMVVPPGVQEYREKNGITWKLKDEPREKFEEAKDDLGKETDVDAKPPGTDLPSDAEPSASYKIIDAMEVDNLETELQDKPADQAAKPDTADGEAVDGDGNAGNMKVDTVDVNDSDQKTEETSTETNATNPQGGSSTNAMAAAPAPTEPPASVPEVSAADSTTDGDAKQMADVGTAQTNPKVVENPTFPPARAEPESAAPADRQEEMPSATAPASDDQAGKGDPGNSDAAMPDAPYSDSPNVADSPTVVPQNSYAPKPEGSKPDLPKPDGEKADSEAKEGEETNDQASADEEEKQKVMAVREGKFAAMARKRTLAGDPVEPDNKKEEKPAEEKKPERKAITVKDSKGRMVKVLDDDEEELDCEFLNNRQAFLNLCQGNHYQFDMLRRAKHSSMMVLWHLHNRDAPKFVQQCATCSREILQGYRFHCPTCADFDQCQDCYQNPNVARHPHPLKPITVANGNGKELTEAQRKDRQRSIQLHMTLLLHAATCNSASCPSANCTKMKGLLKHGAQCQVKATGGCNVCKRIWALLQIHARQCKAKTCPVPNCMAIRERVRQLKKQQQAMDDRRRQEMNRAYRGKR